LECSDYGGGYAGIRASGGDGEVGGLNASGRVGSGGVLVLLYSDDLDATVAQVKDAGGTIAQEPYEFPGGRRSRPVTSSGCGRPPDLAPTSTELSADLPVPRLRRGWG
jgi:predicted enzyme related to lactoylglutathione lyase